MSTTTPAKATIGNATVRLRARMTDSAPSSANSGKVRAPPRKVSVSGA